MKKILIIIPVIIIAIFLVLGFYLDSLIKSGVETLGSRATGASVTLGDVDISLISGKGQIKRFFIGNPKGFQSESAFKLNEVRLALDVRSLLSEKIIINQIYIDAPDITYERSGKTDNIKTILNNVKSFAGQSKGTPQKAAGDKPVKEEKKIEISDVIVKNGKVNMSVAALKGEQLSLDLPDIHLKDIGKNGKGTTLSEAMEQIFGALNKQVGISVKDSVEVMRKTVEKEVDKAVEGTVRKSVDEIKGLLGK